jgi:hypothetical protein
VDEISEARRVIRHAQRVAGFTWKDNGLAVNAQGRKHEYVIYRNGLGQGLTVVQRTYDGTSRHKGKQTIYRMDKVKNIADGQALAEQWESEL